MKFVKVSMLLLVPLLLSATLVFLTTGAASYKVYVIHTGSMSPNIPSGSAVLVHEGHYRVGQVITFKEDGLTVTHRLISISSSGLTTTKGDGNASNDTWHVPTSQIIGGVVLAPRYVGYWITYFKDPLGLASVVLVFLALWQIWAFTGDLSSGAAEGNERTPPKLRRSLFRILTFRPAVPAPSTRLSLAYTPLPELEEHVSTAPMALVHGPEVQVGGQVEHAGTTTLVLSAEVPVEEQREDVSTLEAQTPQSVPHAVEVYEDGFAALSLEMHRPVKAPNAKLKEPVVRTVPRVREESVPMRFSPPKLLRQYESAAPTHPTESPPTRTSPKLLRQYESAAPTHPTESPPTRTSPKLLRQYESTAPKPRDLNPPRKLPAASLKVRDRLG
ncbi:MAG: signal peptidase I [Acidimicrobiales bacterium]